MLERTYKILIADDDKTLLNIECAYIKQYMKQKNLDVSISRQTESFPTLFELSAHGDNYDLIILDNQMPILNGKDLLKSLLPFESTFLKRIVFISSDADDLKEHFPNLGLHFLNKPFSYRDFKTLADDVLNLALPLKLSEVTADCYKAA